MTTAREMVETLTGLEEDAIEVFAGASIDALAFGERDMKLIRVLAAVKVYRDGGAETYAAAWQKIQAMRQSELKAVFEDEPDDVMPNEPDSEAGKDDSPRPGEPMTSPGSASLPV